MNNVYFMRDQRRQSDRRRQPRRFWWSVYLVTCWAVVAGLYASGLVVRALS